MSEDLEAVGKMSEITAFGKRVGGVGHTFNLPALTQYGDALCEYAQNYDLPGIEAVRRKIPAILEWIDGGVIGKEGP